MIENNYNKFISLSENYLPLFKDEEHWKSGRAAEYCDAYLGVLEKLRRNAEKAGDTSELKLVLGFDGENNPVYWNVQKDNLLVTCGAGYGCSEYGFDIAFMDILLRYTKEQIAYYFIAGESAVPYLLADDGRCKGYYSRFQEGGVGEQNRKAAKSAEEVCRIVCDTISLRENMSAEELKNQPFIILAVINGHLNYDEKFFELTGDIFARGQKTKVAVYASDTESLPPYNIVNYLKNRGDCALLAGRTYDETYPEMLRISTEPAHIGGYEKDIMREAYYYFEGRVQKIYFCDGAISSVLSGQKF